MRDRLVALFAHRFAVIPGCAIRRVAIHGRWLRFLFPGLGEPVCRKIDDFRIPCIANLHLVPPAALVSKTLHDYQTSEQSNDQIKGNVLKSWAL
jgi:hypothetical protein